MGTGMGPTSPRNQVVRKPKRTASLASRSYQGTPMLHVSQSSPFQRSRAQAEAPTSRSTTRGPPSISQRPKYTWGTHRKAQAFGHASLGSAWRGLPLLISPPLPYFSTCCWLFPPQSLSISVTFSLSLASFL